MTCVPIIVWDLNSNETRFLARIFPKVRINWVLRLSAQMCPHNLASMSLKLAGGRPLGKVAHLVNYYCKAWRRQTKISPNFQEQCKKPQLQCNTLLIYLYREVWRSFGLFGGNFSLIRETGRDQPAWQIYVSVHKGWPACGIWLRRNPDCWPEGHLQLETWTILIIKRSLQLNFMHISCVTDICLMKISIDSR